jgi:rubrerythrin
MKQSLEDRLSALEIKFTEWEARRRKLIPAELEADENVQLVVKDCLGEYTRKMKTFSGQRRLDDATTEMNRLRAEAAVELERKQKQEMAELLEAIEFYEKYGCSPPGYVIEG